MVFIQQYINEFNQAQQKEQSITNSGDKKWQPPSNERVKLILMEHGAKRLTPVVLML